MELTAVIAKIPAVPYSRPLAEIPARVENESVTLVHKILLLSTSFYL